MCKYNKEENKLLIRAGYDITEDELCTIEKIHIEEDAEELRRQIEETIKTYNKEQLNDYYNQGYMISKEELIKKITEKYQQGKCKCKPETVKACKEAEQCLACKRKDCEGCLLNK